MSDYSKYNKPPPALAKRRAAFLKDYVALCEEHNTTISHEDYHGAFLLEDFRQQNIHWMLDANYEAWKSATERERSMSKELVKDTGSLFEERDQLRDERIMLREALFEIGACLQEKRGQRISNDDGVAHCLCVVKNAIGDTR